MKVKIDVSTLDSRNLTGIGNYIKYTIRELQKLPDITLTGSYRLSRIRKKDLIQAHVPTLPLKPYYPGLSDYLPGFDIFHGPDFRIPPIRTSKKVVTILDMSHLYPEFFPGELREKAIQKMDKTIHRHRPDLIISISDFTKDEISATYPEVAERVHTVHLAADHLTPLPDKGPSPYDFPFVLFVSSLERRKNIQGVICAFEKLEDSLSDLHLVIAGGGGSSREWRDKMVDRMQTSRAAKRIHYLNYADDAMVGRLYSHATCFLFPTFYEGFGIPILESMVHGCPVITSNLGAMKEVAGDAAMLVNPGDADDIAGAITRIVQSQQLRSELIAKGHIRRKQFTWEKCADSTARVYRKLA